MGPAPKPDNENARIQKLHSLNILDSQYELVFDDLTQLASQICSTPISLISLTDSHRQWLKSKKGLEAREFDRDLGFCSYAIMGHELFEIPDARVDDRFKNNPYVLNSPHVVFYAGAPLVTSDGFVLGTLCVIDQIPKKLTETQKSNLQSLSRITSQLIEARNLINKQAEVNVLAERLEMALERANLGIWDWDIGTDRMEYDHRWCSMLGIDPATVKMEPITWKERIHPDDVALCDTTLDRYLKGETTFYECTYRLKHTDGSWRHILSRGSFSGFDHTGKAVRFTGMNFDITAVVEARLQLAE